MSSHAASLSASALPRSHAYAPPADLGLDIVYQDEHVLAINKPSGLLSVPGRSPALQDCALLRVQQRFPHALLVHRLDEATSGLLLLALSPQVQKALSRAFETRQVRKTYLAWVHGLMDASEGVIDAPIRADWPRRPLRMIDHAHGKPARTRHQLLQKNEQLDQSLCGLEPETGRTHQLRLHLQYLGHPIVGDRLYGPPEPSAKRLLLHASSLYLTHPVGGQALWLRCPAPFTGPHAVGDQEPERFSPTLLRSAV
jgi:tRNA pseudouridine32 synthase / 23S rRNA pseudouridine746 synthase